MSKVTLVEPELIRACQVLFGSDLQITLDFLNYLQLSGIKSAYRKRARETHPDVVAAHGELVQFQHAELFREVQEAYQSLLDFLDARAKGLQLPAVAPEARPSPFAGQSYRRPRSNQYRREGRFGYCQAGAAGPQVRPAGDSCHTEKLYHGPMPQRPLLFGHFLYYSGLITWRMIIQALIWQRNQRPRLGQLGQRFGWLTPEKITTILQARQTTQPFGAKAIELGLLNERQVRILLFQQQRLQKKFGEFFLTEGLFAPDQLHQLLARAREHNARLAAFAKNRL